VPKCISITDKLTNIPFIIRRCVYITKN